MQEGPGTDLVADYEQVSHTANEPYTTMTAPARAEIGGDAYVYEALATDQPHIRLVTVWHGARRASYPYPPNESGEILCTIKTFEVDKAPSYIALSYTWGEPIPLHTIRLNGRCYTIRENLFDFLNAFGASGTGRRSHHLWIDQLCINQSDTSERGHQVEMMGDVYRNAGSVISWLDLSCYDAFRDLANDTLDHEMAILDYEMNIDNLDVLDYWEHYYDRMPKLDYHKISASMAIVLSNQYFSRLWIVQEFLLAKDIHFMCGDVWVDLETMETHSKVLQWPRYGPAECWNAHSLFLSRMNLLSSEGEMSLVNVLAHMSRLRCGDSRDQVYGLLGIVESSLWSTPEVNYQKSNEQVYLDAIRIMLAENEARGLQTALRCADALGENMCLSHGHLSAIRKLLADVRMRFESGQFNQSSTRHYLILHTIGFDPPESPVEWWYEYQGVRYAFPIKSDADQSSQNSPPS